MPELVTPDVRYRASWLESLAEWGEGTHQDGAAITAELDPHDADSFAQWVDYLRHDADEDNPRPNGYVPSTNRWIVDGDTYLGAIQLRHRLTPFLHELGGHIGYGVRPSGRRRGLATFALTGMLDEARRRGIDPVLITCDETNEASRRTIESAGGAYEDSREGKRRYWITLAGS